MVLKLAATLAAALVAMTAVPAEPAAAPVAGEFRLEHLQSVGAATLALTDGALVSLGPFEGVLHAPLLRIEVYTYEALGVKPRGPTPLPSFEYQEYGRPEVRTFRDADVAFTGTSEGRLYALSSGRGEVIVDLGPDQAVRMSAAATEWKFTSAGIRDARGSPLLALKQDPDGVLASKTHVDGDPLDDPFARHHIDFSMPEAAFAGATLRGAPRLAVEGATIRVAHGGGVEEFRAGADMEGAGPVASGRETSIVLAPEGGTGHLAVAGTAAVAVAQRAVLSVDGRAVFALAEGLLRSAGKAWSVSGEAVDIEGRLAVALRPLPAARLGEAPRMGAALDGQAYGARLSGELLPPWRLPPPEAKTLLEVALGALAVAALLGSKTVVVLLVRDPARHPRRRRVLDVLRRCGVAHLRELQRETGIPLASLAYHLAILRKAGVVAAVRHRNREVYYLAHGPFAPTQAAALAALTAPGARKVADILAARGRVVPAELAAALGTTPATALRRLRALARAGLAAEVGPAPGAFVPRDLLLAWARAARPAGRAAPLPRGARDGGRTGPGRGAPRGA